jgi:hypothetical protein
MIKTQLIIVGYLFIIINLPLTKVMRVVGVSILGGCGTFISYQVRLCAVGAPWGCGNLVVI